MCSQATEQAALSFPLFSNGHRPGFLSPNLQSCGAQYNTICPFKVDPAMVAFFSSPKTQQSTSRRGQNFY